MLTRKEVLKILATVPAGGLMASGLFNTAVAGPLASTAGAGELKAGPLTPGPDIFRSIGVEPIINCRGTFTIIGGSIEHQFVKEAMHAASNNFIQYDELAEGIGRRLAEITGAEWGMVSSGCAAALKHVTAACVTGGNPEILVRIPDLSDVEKNEVIIPRHSRNVYDHAIRNVGVKVITVHNEQEFLDAMSNRTAMICLLSGRTGELGLENIVRHAKPRGIPVLVDAAAEDLTIPNVHLQMGADVVAYSGGKALCGPQCSGVVLGRKDILMAAWQASSPHHGPGRDNKVGREEMIGALAAVEAWARRDHDAVWRRWLSYLNTIQQRVSGIRGVSTEIHEPAGLGNKSPRLTISWDSERFNLTGWQAAEILGRTKPRIAVGGSDRDNTASISITAGQMQPGEAEIVANRVHEVLTMKHEKPGRMARPAADITGRWNVNVQFFNNESNHTFIIEKQDGNWVYGSHQGDFALRDMMGTIEGNEVKLVSNYRIPGVSVNYIFIGTLNGDSLSGRLFMGEYLNAQFSAEKHTYPEVRRPVNVPGGPPLAT